MSFNRFRAICQYCKADIERSTTNRKGGFTCFDCRAKKISELSKKKREERKLK